MTTAPVKTFLDEQLEEIARSLAVVGAGIPREAPVSALPPPLVTAIKQGRIAVRARQ